MADIFNEVDEEVRRERLEKLWERYSIFIIGAAVLLVAAIGAWRGYVYLQEKKAAAAGSAFESALALSEAGKYKEAEAAFGKIETDAPAGYRALARFRAAAELAHDKPADAIKVYDGLAADASLNATLRDLAAVRAGMLMLDTASLADMQRGLDPAAEPGRSFRHTAREMLALSAWRNHDFTAARRYIDMIASDGDTPPGIRSRADVLSALIAADGKS
ncbi:MAG TPA: tetratricopeptide repeat protein [Pseudolabrys sp.]